MLHRLPVAFESRLASLAGVKPVEACSVRRDNLIDASVRNKAGIPKDSNATRDRTSVDREGQSWPPDMCFVAKVPLGVRLQRVRPIRTGFPLGRMNSYKLQRQFDRQYWKREKIQGRSFVPRVSYNPASNQENMEKKKKLFLPLFWSL